MKIFGVKFEGYWPVGACAVVVAEDRASAQRELDGRLKGLGLTSLPRDEWKEIDTGNSGVTILLDGNY